MKPKVLNQFRDPISPEDVYIGRPSKWGNPYPVTADCSRELAIAKYEEYLNENPFLKDVARRELKGKNLVCFCAPQPCHGDVLLKIANAKPVKQSNITFHT
jgi:hypothetical protein